MSIIFYPILLLKSVFAPFSKPTCSIPISCIKLQMMSHKRSIWSESGHSIVHQRWSNSLLRFFHSDIAHVLERKNKSKDTFFFFKDSRVSCTIILCIPYLIHTWHFVHFLNTSVPGFYFLQTMESWALHSRYIVGPPFYIKKPCAEWSWHGGYLLAPPSK